MPGMFSGAAKAPKLVSLGAIGIHKLGLAIFAETAAECGRLFRGERILRSRGQCPGGVDANRPNGIGQQRRDQSGPRRKIDGAESIDRSGANHGLTILSRAATFETHACVALRSE